MTTSLKPKPVRSHNKSTSQGQRMTKPGTIYSGKTVITKKTMTEQTTPSLETLTKVQSHLPDVQLIDRNALWEDLKNRMRINNYEVSQAMQDLKKVIVSTNKLASPYVSKAVTKVKDFRSNL